MSSISAANPSNYAHGWSGQWFHGARGLMVGSSKLKHSRLFRTFFIQGCWTHIWTDLRGKDLAIYTSRTTDQLQGGEVAFPPEVLGHARAKSCQAVVQIHRYMDQGVDETNQESYGRTHMMSITRCKHTYQRAFWAALACTYTGHQPHT